MKSLVINDSGENVPESLIESWVKTVAAELAARGILPADRAGRELSVVFLKEIDAKHLNWTHRQKDYATDILSFSTDDPESLGELVLCPVVLQKQAKENKQTFEREINYMILHGVLHLLGYDHENVPEDRARDMLALQDQIFEKLTAKPKKAPAKKAAKPAPKPAPRKAAKPAKKTAAKKPAAKKKSSRH